MRRVHGHLAALVLSLTDVADELVELDFLEIHLPITSSVEYLHFFLLLKIAHWIRDNDGLEEVDVVGVEVIKVTDAGRRDPILQLKALESVVRLDEVDDLLGSLFARRVKWKLHGFLYTSTL